MLRAEPKIPSSNKSQKSLKYNYIHIRSILPFNLFVLFPGPICWFLRSYDWEYVHEELEVQGAGVRGPRRRHCRYPNLKYRGQEYEVLFVDTAGTQRNQANQKIIFNYLKYDFSGHVQKRKGGGIFVKSYLIALLSIISTENKFHMFFLPLAFSYI